MPNNTLVAALRDEFVSLRATADTAIGQLDDEALRRSPDGEVNSAAVVMKHMAGNFLSRFTDFLTSGGEKAWRDRLFLNHSPGFDPARSAAPTAEAAITAPKH